MPQASEFRSCRFAGPAGTSWAPRTPENRRIEDSWTKKTWRNTIGRLHVFFYDFADTNAGCAAVLGLKDGIISASELHEPPVILAVEPWWVLTKQTSCWGPHHTIEASGCPLQFEVRNSQDSKKCRSERNRSSNLAPEALFCLVHLGFKRIVSKMGSEACEGSRRVVVKAGSIFPLSLHPKSDSSMEM